MIFDYNKLLEAAAGDEDLVRELVGIFIDECPELLARIEMAVRDNKPRLLHEAAHTLKGPLSSMGAYAALDQVVALETMGINEDLHKADIAFKKLKDMINELVNELNTHKGVLTE